MRWDRDISVFLVAPFQHAFAGADDKRLPILMYHSVSDDPEPGVSPYYKVCIPPERFADHMRWLAEMGWQGVTLSEALDIRAGCRSTTSKSVAITFDDGFRDFGTQAMSILKHHGFRATVYLPTAFIGEDSQSFNSRECLNWDEVRGLHDAGIEFGSHTMTHRVLSDLSWLEVENELRASKATIETRLASSIRSFAHPYAFPQSNTRYTQKLRRILQDVGYESCVTTIVGRVKHGDDLLTLRRLPVNADDDLPLLRAKLEGAYDWLAFPQSLSKRLRLKKRRPTDGSCPTDRTETTSASLR